ncbi:MAG TPA: NfeD family protein [Campylobacterales bacterium]|nr:NfeD family protein [Campylobacterales bacterium]
MLDFLANTLLWWHWIIFGLILLILEIFTGTFIMLGLGIGATIVGVADLILILSLNKELLTWSIISIITITLLFKYFKNNSPKDKSGQSDYAIGIKGIVEEPIDANGRGKVKFNIPILGNTIWHATAKEDIPILTKVKIVNVKGQLIEVEKV